MNGLDKNIPISDYSKIPNDLVLDNRLSGGAIKIYLYLASRPDGWIVKNSDVKEKTGVKSDSIISKYWQELLDAGWLTRKKGTPSSQNKNGFYDYVLMSSPSQQGQSSHEESANFKKSEISRKAKFQESCNFEKVGVNHPPITVNTAPAPAIDNYNINNNNTCLSLTEKEEIKKKEINRFNISSFGSFLLKNCDASEKSENACPDGQKAISQNSGGIQNDNADFDGDMEDDEESAEAFLNECKAVFKANPENADTGISETKDYPSSTPMESFRNMVISSESQIPASSTTNSPNTPKHAFLEDSTSSIDKPLHVTNTDSKGNAMLFDLGNDQPAKEITDNKQEKKDQALQKYRDFIENEIKGLTKKEKEIWQDAFPTLDIDYQIKKAWGWLIGNTSKRKKNIRRFLHVWFTSNENKSLSKNINDIELEVPYPTQASEVIAEAAKIGYQMTEEKAEEFIANYKSKGWMNGNSVIRDWRYLLPRWKSNEGRYPSNSNGRYFGNNKDELKSEWADRVLGKVIGKGMKASPEAIAEMKAYEESGEAPF